MKQLGLAIHNYHDSLLVFPIGYLDVIPQNTETTSTGWALTAYILPYLDQAPLYNQFNFNTTPYAKQTPGGQAVNNQALVATKVPGYLCPSDDNPGVVANNNGSAGTGGGTPAIALCSYMGCSGPFDGAPCANNNTPFVSVDQRHTGVFRVNSSVKIRDMVDGTSNCFAMGEVRYIPRFTDPTNVVTGSERNFSFGMVTTNGGANCNNAGDNNNGSQIHLRWCRKKLNAPMLDASDLWKSYHSRHVGGGHFLLGDGSVRFVSENIDHDNTNYNTTTPNLSGPFGTYQRLASINDGQVVGDY
jgi:hypothetical protein